MSSKIYFVLSYPVILLIARLRHLRIGVENSIRQAVSTSKPRRKKASKEELRLLNELYNKTPCPTIHVLMDVADE